MITNDSTLMQMLSTQMRYMGQRQGVLAQNIANADTPQYRARDLKPLDFNKMAEAEAGRLQLRATSEKHLQGTLGKPGDFTVANDRNTFEISPTGNNVNLEEQMGKVSDTGAHFSSASSLLKKFTGMYRTALGQN